jgi:hypothetical protein
MLELGYRPWFENGQSRAYGGEFNGRVWANAPAARYQFVSMQSDGMYEWDRTYDADGFRVFRPVKKGKK